MLDFRSDVVKSWVADLHKTLAGDSPGNQNPVKEIDENVFTTSRSVQALLRWQARPCSTSGDELRSTQRQARRPQATANRSVKRSRVSGENRH